MNSNTISVVMATYNGEKYIIPQLDSIRNQTIQPDEVIISDDNSTDDTWELVEEYIKRYGLVTWHLIRNQGIHGSTGNFINAMDNSNADLVFLSDQDDVWKPNKIKEMSECFIDTNVMCAISAIRYLTSDGKIKKISTTYTNNKNHNVTFSEHMAVCSYLGMSAAFRKQVIKSSDRGLMQKTSHDWVLFINAALNGETKYLGEPLSLHRIHETNTSNVQGENRIERRANLLNRQIHHIQEIYDSNDLTDSQKNICQEYIDFLQLRKSLIMKKNIISILARSKEYLRRGYNFRNIIADASTCI